MRTSSSHQQVSFTQHFRFLNNCCLRFNQVLWIVMLHHFVWIRDIPKDHNAFILRAKVSNRRIYDEGDIILILQNITNYSKKQGQRHSTRQTSSVLQECTVRRKQQVCSLLWYWHLAMPSTMHSFCIQASTSANLHWLSPCPPASTYDAERPPGTPVNTWCWLASMSVYLPNDTISHQTFTITVWWQYAYRFSWLLAALMTNRMQFTQQFEQVTINFHNQSYLSSIITFPCHFMPH